MGWTSQLVICLPYIPSITRITSNGSLHIDCTGCDRSYCHITCYQIYQFNLPHSRKSVTCFSRFKGELLHSLYKHINISRRVSTLSELALFGVPSTSNCSNFFRRTFADIFLSISYHSLRRRIAPRVSMGEGIELTLPPSSATEKYLFGQFWSTEVPVSNLLSRRVLVAS